MPNISRQELYFESICVSKGINYTKQVKFKYYKIKHKAFRQRFYKIYTADFILEDKLVVEIHGYNFGRNDSYVHLKPIIKDHIMELGYNFIEIKSSYKEIDNFGKEYNE